MERQLKKQLSEINKDRHNKEILTRYYKVRSTEVSLATLWSTLYRLRVMSMMLGKKFEEAMQKDIEELHFQICKRWNHPNTRNKFRKNLKAFYQWLEGTPPGEYPSRVKWIRTEKVPLVTVTEDDLIPHADALRICECADNLRDKCLFSSKLDAGCRIGEILTVKVGEVKMTDSGAVLKSDGKTGRQPLILTWSTPYLTQWLNNHPFKEIPNAPLFCDLTTERPRQLQYAGAHKAFKHAVKRAGIKKRVWFHLFKHISSTEDAANGMPESFRKYKHHWSPNSKMDAVYEHLSQSIIPRIQQETWKHIGITSKIAPADLQEQRTKQELVKICDRCKFENPSGSKYCNRCGFSTNRTEASQKAAAHEILDSFLSKLAKNPRKLSKLVSALNA